MSFESDEETCHDLNLNLLNILVLIMCLISQEKCPFQALCLILIVIFPFDAIDFVLFCR
jgi:hypothetical protein